MGSSQNRDPLDGERDSRIQEACCSYQFRFQISWREHSQVESRESLRGYRLSACYGAARWELSPSRKRGGIKPDSGHDILVVAKEAQ